jgi:hypothetical protein
MAGVDDARAGLRDDAGRPTRGLSQWWAGQSVIEGRWRSVAVAGELYFVAVMQRVRRPLDRQHALVQLTPGAGPRLREVSPHLVLGLVVVRAEDLLACPRGLGRPSERPCV